MLLLVAPAQQPVRIVHVVVGGVDEAAGEMDAASTAVEGEAEQREKSDAAKEKNGAGGGIDSPPSTAAASSKV